MAEYNSNGNSEIVMRRNRSVSAVNIFCVVLGIFMSYIYFFRVLDSQNRNMGAFFFLACAIFGLYADWFRNYDVLISNKKLVLLKKFLFFTVYKTVLDYSQIESIDLMSKEKPRLVLLKAKNGKIFKIWHLECKKMGLSEASALEYTFSEISKRWRTS